MLWESQVRARKHLSRDAIFFPHFLLAKSISRPFFPAAPSCTYNVEDFFSPKNRHFLPQLFTTPRRLRYREFDEELTPVSHQGNKNRGAGSKAILFADGQAPISSP